MNDETETVPPAAMKLLERTRLGMLVQTKADGAGIGLPVWFDWTGAEVRMFAAEASWKVARARRDPRASLVVTNDVDEPSAWVAFDGDLVVTSGRGIDLAVELAARYMDLEDPEQRQMLAEWKQHPDVFCELTLCPIKIRTGQ